MYQTKEELIKTTRCHVLGQNPNKILLRLNILKLAKKKKKKVHLVVLKG